MPTLGHWDIAWIVAVAIQATLTAYVAHPQAKALLITIPLPFSIAFLALGKPIESSHILGGVLLVPFLLIIRLIHVKLRRPISWGIAASVLFYCGAATVLVRILPQTETSFYAITAAALCLAVSLIYILPYQAEPSHRSRMPVWLKLLLIVIGILLLVQAKQTMRGFITLFPLVTSVAAYEARHSLWTMVRQVPVKMVSVTLMMLGMHLTQPRLGPLGAIAVGWCIFAVVLPVATRLRDRRHGASSQADAHLYNKCLL